MKKLILTAAALLCAATGAQALETSVKPKVTTLGIDAPKTGLYVGNSFTYYNCGVNGYVRGFTGAAKLDWKARMTTISAAALIFLFGVATQMAAAKAKAAQVCPEGKELGSLLRVRV